MPEAKKGSLDDLRPPMREPMRDEDPRDRARRKAEEIIKSLGDISETTDDFYIPPDIIPDGWTYEWKRHSILNEQQDIYLNERRRFGWDFVPAKRHVELSPIGWTGDLILRKGMVLMERPVEVTEYIKSHDRKAARDLIKVKEDQLSAAPSGQFERSNKDQSLVKIKKSVEPMPIPE